MRKTFTKILAFMYICATFPVFGVACAPGNDSSSSMDNSSMISVEDSSLEETSSVSPEDEYNETATKGLYYSYIFSEDGMYAKVVGIGTATGTDIRIPTKVRGCPVIAIGEGALPSSLDLTSVIIPDTVQTIDGYAIRGELTSIVIGAGIQKIGEDGIRWASNVYYKGTASDWEKVVGRIPSDKLFYYIENGEDLPNDGGLYWHYVNGKPTAW